jgi:rare lipoprotein A (peptidoglycan hydrolase)
MSSSSGRLPVSVLATREIALIGVALLAAAIALAVTAQTRHHAKAGPKPVGDYIALAGSSGPQAFGRKTACGGVITSATEGVSHPTLPCGVRIFIRFHGQTLLVPVIDRGPYTQGREFDLTDALARRVGLRGVQEIHWSFAEAG